MKNLTSFYLGIIVILSVVIHFWGLNWGTPNWQRTLQAFGSVDEIKKVSNKMLSLREKFYSSREDLISGRTKINKETIEKVFHGKETKPWEFFPEDVVLDASRGYLLGLTNSDEQHAISVLSRMNIRKLDLNPHDYFWGGFYFYSAGFFLLLGKLFGLYSFNSDISYYFFHPEEITNMYTFIRSLSAISVIISVLLLYFIIKPFFGKKIAILSTIFFSVSPLLLIFSHSCKPHTYGLMWILLGLYFCSRIFIEPKNKYFFATGIFLGLATGSLITNAIFFVMLFLVEYIINNYKLKGINYVRLIKSCLCGVVAFLATNFYLITSMDEFFRSATALIVGFRYGQFELSEMLNFLITVFTQGIHWTSLPLLIIGIFLLIKKQNPLGNLLLIGFSIFFLFNVFFMRHQGLWGNMYPLTALVFALSVDYLFSKKRLKWVGVPYSIIVITVLLLNVVFYESFFVQKGFMTSAGGWINQNIPKGSTIGVPGGWFDPGGFPSFRFLNYKMVNFPRQVKIDGEKDKLPEFVIAGASYVFINQLPGFKNYYQKIKEWDKGNKILGIYFGTEYICSENLPVKIYKKMESKK